MRSKNFSWRYSLAATVLLLSPFDLLASLGMDMYLPAVPFMPNALGTTASTIQLTLTTYLVMIGAGQLLFGPLSDRLGRRPVLLGGGLAYVVASMGLALTSSAEVFLGLRILQACGASACLVSTFATVRDIYAGREESNVIYGILGSMLAMVPAVGPLLGALVDMWLGWRAIFAFLGLGMIAASAAAWRFWPETRVQRVAGLQWSQLLLPVKCLNFWLYTLCYAAGMGSFFVFFSIAPGLMMGRQGVSQLGFSLLFATVAIAMVFTARFMGRVIPKWGSPSVLRMGMGMPDSWSSIACHHRNMGFAVRVRLYCSNVASGYWCRHSGICVAQWRSSRIRPCCWNGHGSLLLLGRCTARKHRNVDHFAVAAQHGLAGCRVLFDPCNSRARSVLCFPSEGLSRPGGA